MTSYPGYPAGFKVMILPILTQATLHVSFVEWFFVCKLNGEEGWFVLYVSNIPHSIHVQAGKK